MCSPIPFQIIVAHPQYQHVQAKIMTFSIRRRAPAQRPKKSELSTRKNFPGEVRKSFSRQKKRVNRFSDKKSVRKFFLRQKSVHKSFLQQKSVHKSFLQ